MTPMEDVEEAPVAEDEEIKIEQFAPPENLEDQQWWPYVHVLAAPVCVAADPTATAAQHTASVELIRALCSDDSRPKDDQSLVCDRFAATACAMGVLVPLYVLWLPHRRPSVSLGSAWTRTTSTRRRILPRRRKRRRRPSPTWRGGRMSERSALRRMRMMPTMLNSPFPWSRVRRPSRPISTGVRGGAGRSSRRV